MFRTALTTGQKVCMDSSWKLLISATITDSGFVSEATQAYGLPMFPTTYTLSL